MHSLTATFRFSGLFSGCHIYNVNFMYSHSQSHTSDLCIPDYHIYTFQVRMFHHFSAGSSAQFQCDLCNKVCATRESLRIHRARHEGKYKYHCPMCNKGCSSTNQLRGHMSSHTGKKDFKCAKCGKDFSFKCNFVCHTKKCYAM